MKVESLVKDERLVKVESLVKDERLVKVEILVKVEGLLCEKFNEFSIFIGIQIFLD